MTSSWPGSHLLRGTARTLAAPSTPLGSRCYRLFAARGAASSQEAKQNYADCSGIKVAIAWPALETSKF